jgi:CHAT domain-containing protein
LAAREKEFRSHSNPDWREPYVWAAFQLSGDWGPLKGL